MDTIREAPKAASMYMLAGVLQFSAVAAWFMPPTLGSIGWQLVLIILALSAVLFGIATLLQRLLMPGRRTVFSLGVLWTGIVVSLINSILLYVST